MTPSTRADRFWIACLSLVMALALWLQVQAQADQTKERVFNVQVELQNLPEGLTPLSSVREVEFVATGPGSKLDALRTSEWRAVVDVSRGTVGEKIYAIKATGPSATDVTVQPRIPRLSLSLARITTTTKRVIVEEIGRLLPDLSYGGAKPEPDTVELTGPEPTIKRVFRLRALLNLSQLRPGDTPSAIVEVLGEDGRTLPNVEVSPPSVAIRPKVVAAPAQVDVIVAPRWKGQPAFGFEIVSVAADPNQITLRGPSRLLSSIPKVLTAPIDLTGVKSDRTFRTRIVLPAGVQTDDPTSVTITVKVARVLPPTSTEKTDAMPAPATQPDGP